MERKRRYCPQCGSKTNDMRCEICERQTKLITERFHESYLDLVSDDIETFEHSETFDHIKVEDKTKQNTNEDIVDDVQENLDNVKKNIRYQRRPQTSTNPFSNTSFDLIKEKLKVIVIVIVMVGVLGNVLFSMMNNDTYFEDSSISDQDYTQYLISVDEQAAYDVSVITKDNGEMYAHVVNSSPYYLQMYFYDKKDDSTIDAGPYMYFEPYSDVNFAVSTTEIRSEVVGVYDLDFNKPTISYVYEINKDGSSKDIITLKEYPTEGEIDTLMQHIYAGKQINYWYSDVNIFVQVDHGESIEQIYDCMLYLNDGIITYYKDGEILREIEVDV